MTGALRRWLREPLPLFLGAGWPVFGVYRPLRPGTAAPDVGNRIDLKTTFAK